MDSKELDACFAKITEMSEICGYFGRAFVTGSHAYGTPHDQSDVDLVVLLESSRDLDLLRKIADNDSKINEQYDGVCLRFGKLNLLCTLSQIDFDIWWEGTEDLILKKPVTRDVAVEHFRELRTRAKNV